MVAQILNEAAAWLQQGGSPMWKARELEPASIVAEVGAGLFFLAECSGDAAGTVKFELHDPIFWPEMPLYEAAYVHRLAVRRRYAGMGLSAALLGWAVGRARGLGRRYLRLDCESSRPRLRAVYESFGFRHHSDLRAGPYHVSRYEYDVAGSDLAPEMKPAKQPFQS